MVEVPKSSLWLCDCGKNTEQPIGGKLLKTCLHCGHDFHRIQDPDGIITEFLRADEWFAKQFEERDQKCATIINTIHMWEDRRYVAEKTAREQREALDQERKKLKNTVEEAAKRHKYKGEKLNRMKDMQWQYNPAMRKWMGRKVEKPKGVK